MRLGEQDVTTHKAGFTLVEVMIASAGVALGFLGVLASFSVLTQTARLIGQEHQALHLARQQIEQIRTHSMSDAELALGTHSFSGGAYIVSAYTYPTTKQITLSLNVVAPNNRTSQITVATVMSSNLHK